MKKALIADPADWFNWGQLADRRDEAGSLDEQYIAETAAIRRTRDALKAGTDHATAFTALIRALPDAGSVREAYANWVEALDTEASRAIAQTMRSLTPRMRQHDELAYEHWRQALSTLGVLIQLNPDSVAADEPGLHNNMPEAIAFTNFEHFLTHGRSIMQALPVEQVALITSYDPRDFVPPQRPQEVVDALTGWDEWRKVKKLMLLIPGLSAEHFQDVLASDVIQWDQLRELTFSNFPINAEGMRMFLDKSMSRLKNLQITNAGLNDDTLRQLADSPILPRLGRAVRRHGETEITGGLNLIGNDDISEELLAQMQNNARNPAALRYAAEALLAERGIIAMGILGMN